MLDLGPTDILIADQLAQLVRVIAPGDTPYLFQRIDETGRLLNLTDDYVSGGYLVLVFVPDLTGEPAASELRAFEQRAASFEAANAKVVIITAQSNARANREAKRRLGISFPVLGDPGGFAFAAYGLHKRGMVVTPTQMRSVVISPYRQIRRYWDIEMKNQHAENAETLIKQAKLAEETSWAAPHPPVLITPQVFSSEECVDLISAFKTNGALQILPPKPTTNPDGVKIPVYEYDRQDRIDHLITDPKLLAFIDERLKQRVYPAIRRAFAFAVTRRENLQIARYAGARSGVEIGHRDNVSAMTHRRFALSVSLNDDYEGGSIAFREYSDKGYRLPAGTALIFSSSLLHEVAETTQGVRYNLLSHFYNDASATEAGRR